MVSTKDLVRTLLEVATEAELMDSPRHFALEVFQQLTEQLRCKGSCVVADIGQKYIRMSVYSDESMTPSMAVRQQLLLSDAVLARLTREDQEASMLASTEED